MLESFHHSEQINPTNKATKQHLWNELHKYYWSRMETISIIYSSSVDFDIEHPQQVYYNSIVKNMVKSLWIEYLNRPIDDFKKFSNSSWIKMNNYLKNYFFNCSMEHSLDFILFISSKDPTYGVEFSKNCNLILEQTFSTYRILDGKPINTVTEIEIQNIKNTLSSEFNIPFVREHINTSLELLNKGHYRNSIKESISAVESICKTIAGENKATLGEALKKLDTNLKIHKALKNAFQIIYGYTSDADGIRHALMNESSLDYEDALYMLTTCSSFINYLIVKARKSGINLHTVSEETTV